ncbi:Cobalt-precorrin-6A reductase [Candidatus Entotheonellaceae bacterium PAL068K]
MQKTVLLLSGTSEGPRLARALLAAGFDVTTTVTREAARQHLFGDLLHAIRAEVRGFTEASLKHYLAPGGVDLVLDATHPFAVRITNLAAAVCTRLGVPYVRYQRPEWEPPQGTLYAPSYAAAAATCRRFPGRSCIMLTIGAKPLKHFAPLHDHLRLVARVLPSPVSVQLALDAGFTQAQIVALRPPFSRAFNASMLREYTVDVLVTKASGVAGGVVEKVLAAHDLGLTTLMILRPASPDRVETVSTLEAAIHACQTHVRQS